MSHKDKALNGAQQHKLQTQVQGHKTWVQGTGSQRGECRVQGGRLRGTGLSPPATLPCPFPHAHAHAPRIYGYMRTCALARCTRGCWCPGAGAWARVHGRMGTGNRRARGNGVGELFYRYPITPVPGAHCSPLALGSCILRHCAGGAIQLPPALFSSP